VAKVLEGFGGPIDARALKGETQDATLIGRADRTLALINLQLEMVLEKPSQAGFEAVACALTLDDEQKVITVAGEVMAAPFQFLVQVV